MRYRRCAWAGLLAASLTGACGSGSKGGPASAADGASSAPDAEPLTDPDADQFIPCTDDPRADHYTAGMQKTGPKGQLAVTLVSADPGPPIKGTNTWTVLVTDTTAGPQSGATLKVTPFMPDHGHGTSVKPVISALTDAGQYKVTPLYLFMAGLWQVTLDVTTSAGTRDAIVFSFCVER
jgi:hypothetical protein